MNDILKAFLMGLYEPRVQIGIAQGIAYREAHGVIHSATGGHTAQHTFVADQPRLLRRPSQGILEQVFRQAGELGLRPRHVEIFVGSRRQIYNDKGALVFAQ